jgi:hypothetical protein
MSYLGMSCSSVIMCYLYLVSLCAISVCHLSLHPPYAYSSVYAHIVLRVHTVQVVQTQYKWRSHITSGVHTVSTCTVSVCTPLVLCEHTASTVSIRTCIE